MSAACGLFDKATDLLGPPSAYTMCLYTFIVTDERIGWAGNAD
jgi:hypothetical protein